MDINWIKYNFVEDVLDAQSYQTIYIENIKTLEKSGYKLMKLSSVCKSIYRGNTPEHIDGIIPKGALLLKTTNIRSNELDLSKIFCMEEEVYINEGRFKLNENDICITIMGATNDIVGRSWVYSSNIGPACFSDGIAKIEDVRIDSSFLSTYINSRYGHLSIIQWSGSSTRSYITNKQLGDIKIPIPSKEIQKCIGDKVRRAEELREKAKKLKEEAERILSMALDVEDLEKNVDNINLKYNWIGSKTIEDRIDSTSYNPIVLQIKDFYKNFNKEKLKDIASYKKGFAFKSKDYIDDQLGVYMLRVTDINGELIDYDSMIRLPQRHYEELNQFSLEHKDIVMVVTGNTTGKSVIVHNESGERILLNQNAIRLRINDKYDPYYVDMLIKSKYFQNLLKYSLYQSVQPFISLEFLDEVEIPMIDDDLIERVSKLYSQSLSNLYLSKQLIQEAKQDVEDLIEGKLDMFKLNETTPESR